MKRTNLVLDANLLGEALKLSGCPTYSAALNEALEEYCRIKKLEYILELLRNHYKSLFVQK
jgi:Arc/MetJ family transcription regulator